MPVSINPYGYAPSMLAVANELHPQRTEKPIPPPTQFPSHDRASIPPKTGCPLLAAPYEIRAQILSYILPCTIASREKEVIWLRGNIAILLACRKLYEECRGLLYGTNWFLIDIHFNIILFNYQWLIVTDFSQENYGRNLGPEYKMKRCSHRMIPSRKMDFVCHFSTELRALMRKFVVRMHLVDGYEGMIKFNITNEQVLREGVVKLFNQFKDRTLPNKDREMQLIVLKLMGDEKQINDFKTRCWEMMEAIQPGWLSYLAQSIDVEDSSCVIDE